MMQAITILIYLKIAAFVIYILCALYLFIVNPSKRYINKIASLLCVCFAVWTLQSILTFSISDYSKVLHVVRGLNWSWTLFPMVALHLAAEIFITSHKANLKVKNAFITAAYLIAALFYYLLSWPILEGGIWHPEKGYWSFYYNNNIVLLLYDIYYILALLIGMTLVIINLIHSKRKKERNGYLLLVVTQFIAMFGAVVTDTIAPLLKLDWPMLGNLWSLIWILGCVVAIGKDNFLAVFSSSEKELLFDHFINQSLDGICICDYSLKILTWNKTLVKLTGISCDDALKMNTIDILRALKYSNDEVEILSVDRILAYLNTKQDNPYKIRTLQITNKYEEVKVLQTNPFKVDSAAGYIWVFIFRDVTKEVEQHRETMEKIRQHGQQQRMEMIGALAGGVAHDFNNTLAGMLGAVSLLKSGLDDKEICKEDFALELNIIQQSAERAAASVRSLTSFISKRKPDRIVFDLVECVDNIVNFYSRSKDPSIRLSNISEVPRARAIGDARLCEQIILNILINAEHAMTVMRPQDAVKGGKTSIVLDEFSPSPLFLSSHLEASSCNYWRLSITDEGIGIDEKNLKKIFNPYFSTKKKGKGSGLGLAMAQLLANQQHGFITVDSTVNIGSTFSFFLPVPTLNDIVVAEEEFRVKELENKKKEENGEQ